MRRSSSACMRSQMAHPQGRMTMVPRTGPLSASSAWVTTSWYQRGKSLARGVRGEAMDKGGYVSEPGPRHGRERRGEEGVGDVEAAGGQLLHRACGCEHRGSETAQVHRPEVDEAHPQVRGLPLLRRAALGTVGARVEKPAAFPAGELDHEPPPVPVPSRLEGG